MKQVVSFVGGKLVRGVEEVPLPDDTCVQTNESMYLKYSRTWWIFFNSIFPFITCLFI